MKFITKIGVTCTTIAMMASTISYAGTVPTATLTSELVDNYIGADGSQVSIQDIYGGSDYNIEWITVDKSVANELTVQVKSAFVSHNTSSGYDLGDLFIMDAANYTEADACTGLSGKVGCNENSKRSEYSTVKSTNKWDYAFDLGGQRGTNGTNVSGDLRDIANTGYSYSSDVVETSKSGVHRGWQAIYSTNNPTSVGSGTWSSDVGNDILTMTFDISGASSLMGAAQLALRWQMTCANDIIEVVTNFTTSGGGGGGSTPVPEPSTFILMLLAGFGLFASKQKKAIKFKA